MLEDDAYFIILVCNYEQIKIILFYQFYHILKTKTTLTLIDWLPADILGAESVLMKWHAWREVLI
jgi:hypothetical protein